MQPFGHNTWAKIGGAVPGLRSTSEPSGILIHPAVWPQQTWTKNWGCAPFVEGELGPHLKHCGRGRGLPPCRVLSWFIQPFGHNTPTSQTDNGLIAYGELFYKRSSKNIPVEIWFEWNNNLTAIMRHLYFSFFIRNNEICCQNFSVCYCCK